MEDKFKDDPGAVDDGHVEDHRVQSVVGLVNLRVVVVKQHEEGHLVQHELLAKSHVQIVCFYLL